jgi:hypothetical protein
MKLACHYLGRTYIPPVSEKINAPVRDTYYLEPGLIDGPLPSEISRMTRGEKDFGTKAHEYLSTQRKLEESKGEVKKNINKGYFYYIKYGISSV